MTRCSSSTIPLLSFLTWLGPATANADDAPEISRGDVLAAYYMGFAIGVASFDAPTRARLGVGPGMAFGGSFGVAFGHEFPVNFGFGFLFPDDRRPFTEPVVTCSSYDGTDLGCTGPEETESHVTGAYASIDGGYQPRFQIMESLALLPGALLGYLSIAGELERGIGCEGCTERPISDSNEAGWYVAPALRTVLGIEQFFALSIRSQWFVTGHFQHMTVLGVEFIAP